MKKVLLNSTFAFVAAFVMTTLVHELGHYLSYWLFGADPTLFHNYVRTSSHPLSIHAKVISALAGPVMSLVQGIVFGLFISKSRKNAAHHLLLLWLSLLGFVNFFGYLMMTPLSTVGDTGKAAELLNIEHSTRIIIAIIGFAALLWIIFKVAKTFSNFIPGQVESNIKSKYVYHLMFFPIIIGSVLNTLLALPAVAVLSIIYPATSPYVIMSSFGAILKSPNPQASKSEIEDQISMPLVLLTCCMVLLNRLLTVGLG